MLFDDLTLDFSWETCLFSYCLSLRIMTFLHEVEYLDIVLHGVQLYQLSVYMLALYLVF